MKRFLPLSLRYRLAEWLRATRLCRFFVIRTHGYKIHFHPSAMALSMWVDPNNRDDDFHFIHSCLSPGDTYIDVGANIGTTVIPGAQCVTLTGRVFAFEPHPRGFMFLTENLLLNGINHVTAKNIAIGSEPGVLRISDRHSDDQNFISAEEGCLQIPVQRLDDVIPEQLNIDLLKVDTEGFEFNVFCGGQRCLERTKTVYFEVCSSHYSRYGFEPRHVFDLLISKGFQLFILRNGDSLIPLEKSDWDETSLVNVVASRAPESLSKQLKAS